MLVLVVDDEIGGRKTLELFTKKLGYDVLTASNGEEAWKIWKEESPKILITDWNMPKMDGVELTRKIRSVEGDEYTYIIIVTARDESKDLIQGLEAGADDYLTKPVNKAELLARLRASERVFSLQSKDVLVFALAKLAEAKDSDTGFHLERMRHYTKTLAETLHDMENPPDEVNRQFISNLFITSPLHDIGKVGIPDHILLKPARLDDREFEIMKSHSLLGWETLIKAYEKSNKAGYLKMSADIARSHHEKWDGTGYPDKASGKDIPLCARIMALADVYDALVSKRAYKDAFSHDTARSIIVKGKGEHFDPQIVEAFLICEEKFIDIRKSYSDV